MSERIQRILWAGVLVAAVSLGFATYRLWRYSRTVAVAPATSGYGLVYVSNRDGTYRLYTCGPLGENDRPLPGSVAGDVLPACQTGASEGNTSAAVAFLRVTDPERGADEVGMLGAVCVLPEGRREAITVSGAIARVLTVAPAWSPSGDRIAFAAAEDSNADGKFTADETGLYIATLDGHAPTRVAAGPGDDTNLSWSPNGKALLFQTRSAGRWWPTARLLDLADNSIVTRDEQTTVACWSPDGQHIAAYGMIDRRVHVLSATDGSEEYSVDGPQGDWQAALTYLAWLPEEGTSGQWLALVSQSSSQLPGVLYVRRAEADSALKWKPLEKGINHAMFPAVSPDGKWIAFSVPGPSRNDLSLVTLPVGGKPVTLFPDTSFSGLACWRSHPARGDQQ